MKKKFMSVMLAATLVVSLVGCGKKNNNNTATDADDTSNKAITAEEYNATIASNAAVYKKYITLPEYKGIAVSVDKSSLTVSDDDVETYISNILSSYATSEQVTEGTTASGDIISLDYSGKLDGVAFSGGTATDVSYTIGSGKFITDLDQGLVGLNVGQEYDIPCTFPSDYSSSDLAGKSVIFTVTVHSITKKTIPELTDEWVAANAESMGIEGTTVEALRKETREYLENSGKSTYDSNKYSAVYEVIKKDITVNGYPQAELDSLKSILKQNMEAEYNQYQSYYSAQGISDFSSYLSSVYNLSDDAAYDDYATQTAQEYLLEKMVLTIIAADNGIDVSADDINEIGATYASYYGYTDYQEILDTYGNEMNAELGYEKLSEKVQSFLNDNSVEQ